jgi:hypothetical protein
MNKYIGVSAVYGFARSVGPVNNLKVTSGKEMPVATKVALISYATVSAPVYLPMYMMNDLNRIFINVSGENPEDYGYRTKKTSYDIIFT